MDIRKSSRHVVVAGLAAGLLFASAQVGAHAKLVSVVPAANSTVQSPKMIEVHFDEAIEVKLSKLTLAMGDGVVVSTMGMNNAKDPSMLAIMPNAALKPGVYTATWSVVTDDGHKEKGSFKFTVK
ncbi:MAG: copper homeostasis periplasmic binding protein CopC [Pseudomonadota bacterium]